MKFIKLSVLIVFVLTVAIFIYCDSNDNAEEAIVQEDPLQPGERELERSRVELKIELLHISIMRHFKAEQWDKMFKAYEEIEKNGGTIKITTEEGSIVAFGAGQVTDLWKCKRETADNMIITKHTPPKKERWAEHRDFDNVDRPAHPDAFDMEVVAFTKIDINPTYYGETTRRHKRRCIW